MSLNRIEVLNELKKLPKPQLFKAFVKLSNSYQDYAAQNKLSWGEVRYLREQMLYYKGKYEAIKDKVEPVKPKPLKFEPFIDYEQVIQNTVNSLRTPTKPLPTPSQSIIVVPSKKCFLARITNWIIGR